MLKFPRFVFAAALLAFATAPARAQEATTPVEDAAAAEGAAAEESAAEGAEAEETATEDAEAEEAPAEAAATEGADAETRELAERYLSMPAIQKMNDDLYGGNMLDSMMGMQDAMPEEVRATMAKILTEEFAKIRPGLEAAMIESAAAIFTADELRAMIAFYDSPEGASVAAKTMPFTQKTFEVFGPQMEEFQRAIVQRLMKEVTPPQRQ